jgi:biotin carboxyl carrier protein
MLNWRPVNRAQNPGEPSPAPPKSAMAKKWLVAIRALTFAFVLMPFLLWYMTTFTRPLTDRELGAYFTDTLHPRRAQHALSQVADRIMSPNPAIRESARPWYPEVVKSAAQGSDELRVTAAWVMGQDNQSPEFHAALLKQLTDTNPMVRRNAALSLVRFADPSGHDVIAGMLQPYQMLAPRTGSLATRLKPDDVINPGTLVAHVAVAGESVEVRSEVPGTIGQWTARDGEPVQAGQPILIVDPSPEMVWESLRALYLIGQKADAADVDRYARGVQGMPPQIQQQATLTARAISTRQKNVTGDW